MTTASSDPLQVLPLDRYRALIRLDERPEPPHATAEPGDVRLVLDSLLAEPWATRFTPSRPVGDAGGEDTSNTRATLANLLTLRPPEPLDPEISERLDRILATETRARPQVDPSGLPTLAEDPALSRHPHSDRIVLWRGDMTTLAADAIVNAANARLLGCFQPGHRCIDNAIHAAAGPALRADCSRIMQLQGHDEPTGNAKITRAHHLPANYVLHTVGPIIDGPLTPGDERLLASSYRSCLDLAAAVGGISTIAFCSISTGLFGYPIAPAARTAIDTVVAWLDDHPAFDGRIVFDVFSSNDEAAYRHAFAATTTRDHR